MFSLSQSPPARLSRSLGQAIDHYRKYHDIPQYSLLVTPKFCISSVVSFSWELKWPHEKLKTMLMQNVVVVHVCYGILCSGQLV